jgi:hypothetical protein
MVGITRKRLRRRVKKLVFIERFERRVRRESEGMKE